jgi:hypothetical protein
VLRGYFSAEKFKLSAQMGQAPPIQGHASADATFVGVLTTSELDGFDNLPAKVS